MSQEQTKRAKYWYIFGRHLSTTWSPAIFVASYIYICTMQGILIHTYFQMLCNSGIEPCDHKFPFWTKCWFYNGGSLRNQQSNQCLNTPHPKLMNPQILSFNSKTAGSVLLPLCLCPLITIIYLASFHQSYILICITVCIVLTATAFTVRY